MAPCSPVVATPDQADVLLQKHRTQLVDAQRNQRRRETALHQLRSHNITDPRTRTRTAQRAESARQAIAVTIEDLEDAGLVVRALTPRLLVDVAACRNGERVWLCWSEGEKQVSFWHSQQSGREGRRPIEDRSATRWSSGEGLPTRRKAGI